MRFCDVSCCSSFHFWSSNLLLYLYFSMFFILLLFFSLLFDVVPHPSVDYYRGFYNPFYTFRPTHCRLIRDTFICSNIPFLPLALLPWVCIFLLTGVFYLTFLQQHFNLRLSRFPREPAVFPWSLQGVMLSFETLAWPICWFDSQ